MRLAAEQLAQMRDHPQIAGDCTGYLYRHSHKRQLRRQCRRLADAAESSAGRYRNVLRLGPRDVQPVDGLC